MATFVTLANFTDQGVKNIKDSPARLEAFKAMGEKHGLKVLSAHWTLGTYDLVLVIEAPDDESMAAAGVAVGMLGNVRTQTLRAFDPAAMKGILGRV
jgi:uncharacterized protein with GYD domain